MLSAKILIKKTFSLAILLLIVTVGLGKAWAQDNINDDSSEVPNRYGLGITSGFTYDPTNDIRFLQINAFALYDYEKIWHNNPPEPLRFKIEGNLGLTTHDSSRAVCSLNFLALYFLDKFSNQVLRPYVEAGIGVIYTDFQVKGQGLRVNFNPQLGIGAEILEDSEPKYYLAVRAHHVSNGEIDTDDNRGINSVVLVVGRFF